MIHGESYFEPWAQLASWEYNLNRDEATYTSIKLGPTDKYLPERDAVRHLIEDIEMTDNVGEKAPGNRTSPLSRIHLALFRSDAALTLEYKLSFSDVEHQRGGKVTADEKSWERFKVWLTDTHRRLYSKQNGLSGVSRCAQYKSATKNEAPDASGAHSWMKASREDMKNSKARSNYDKRRAGVSEKYYRGSINRGSHNVLRKMIKEKADVVSETGNKTSTVTTDKVNADLKQTHKLDDIDALVRRVKDGKFTSKEADGSAPSGEAAPANDTTNNTGDGKTKAQKNKEKKERKKAKEKADKEELQRLRAARAAPCSPEVATRPANQTGTQTREPRAALDEKALEYTRQIASNEEQKQRLKITASDMVSIQSRLRQSMPNDRELQASRASPSSRSCDHCAKTRWGQAPCVMYECRNCETHCTETCQLVTARELFGKDLVGRISDEFWGILVNKLYPSRPRWGTDTAYDAERKAQYDAWKARNQPRGNDNNGKY
eukprot:SAG31_NODE_2518_length_5574_cov_9.105205_9_plen_491_part_00